MFTMVANNRIPSTEKALQQSYLSCEKRGKFKQVGRASYSDYFQRAQKDLISAERDLQAGDFHWARIKAYQSLFHLLNAILVKHWGYFSKDHSCVIVALMQNNLITADIAARLHLLTEKTIKGATAQDIYGDIDEFRIQRNFALYKPKAWENVKKEDVEEELTKIKNNFNILVKVL